MQRCQWMFCILKYILTALMGVNIPCSAPSNHRVTGWLHTYREGDEQYSSAVDSRLTHKNQPTTRNSKIVYIVIGCLIFSVCMFMLYWSSHLETCTVYTRTEIFLFPIVSSCSAAVLPGKISDWYYFWNAPHIPHGPGGLLVFNSFAALAVAVLHHVFKGIKFKND